MTVEAIENAINELEYDAWDRQMVEDFSPTGRGMALVEAVKREIADGKTMPLQEGLLLANARRDQPQH